jgi:hypothetical protein
VRGLGSSQLQILHIQDLMKAHQPTPEPELSCINCGHVPKYWAWLALSEARGFWSYRICPRCGSKQDHGRPFETG